MTPLRIFFGVREATGIHDQRFAVRGNLNVQQIVMTVAAVADWTAIKDQILLIAKIRFVISPTAALNEVTAVWKTRKRFRGFVAERAGSRGIKKIRAVKDKRREFQQVRVVSRVRVRECRYETIRTLNVEQKLTCLLKTLVITRRELQSESSRVFASAEIRTQGGHVVMRRLFAVHTIRSDVSQQVSMQLSDGEIEQVAVVQLRQRERSNEQCIKFQSAVIALGSQVVT